MDTFPKNPVELPGDKERLPNLGLELREYVASGTVPMEPARIQALEEIIGALGEGNAEKARTLSAQYASVLGKNLVSERLHISLYRGKERESPFYPFFKSAA